MLAEGRGIGIEKDPGRGESGEGADGPEYSAKNARSDEEEARDEEENSIGS